MSAVYNPNAPASSHNQLPGQTTLYSLFITSFTHSNMHASLKALTLIAAAASSASALSFKLRAHVTANDLSSSIEGYQVSVDSSNGNAYLVPPGNSPVFVNADNTINTDATGSTTHIHITPGGTATVPSSNVVTFTSEAGTQGVGIKQSILAYNNGVFVACPASVLEQPSGKTLISFKNSGQRTLAGCADLELQPFEVQQ